MNKTMDASASKARKAEDKASGLIKVNLGSVKKEGGGGGGFKKGGFKSAFAGNEGKEVKKEGEEKVVTAVKVEEMEVDSEEEEDYEVYDPRKPTECPPDCHSKLGVK